MKADLHNHTKYSNDGLTAPITFVKTAKKKGLDAIAITDHNSIRAWPELAKLSKHYGVEIIFGEEIMVFEEKKCVGEIIGLFLTDYITPSDPKTVIDTIRAQGGLSIIAHPFDSKRKQFKSLEEFARKVDAVEEFNSRCILNQMNKKAKHFVSDRGLIGTVGSDSHTPPEIANSYIDSPATSSDELKKDIQKGRFTTKTRLASPLVH